MIYFYKNSGIAARVGYSGCFFIATNFHLAIMPYPPFLESLCMLTYPHLDPIAFSLGPVQVHWYGLMYLASFLLVALYLRWRIQRYQLPWSGQMVDDILTYGVLGVILGGRLGFVLFYQLNYYLHAPSEIFQLWRGGMSFHGGLLGVIIAMMIYTKVQKKSFLDLADFIVPSVPIGLGLGRLGNFINGELWGRVASADTPWAMVFPQARDGLARHPSQLYQLLIEGLLLFIILAWYAKTPRKTGRVAAVFLMLYGCGRIFTEFFREPDYFLGFKMGYTMGQWLSLPLIIFGALLWWYAGKATPVKQEAETSPAI